MRHPAVLVAWATAAAVIIIDQVTKAWAVAVLEGQPDRQIIGDLLRLSFVRNPGAAFGLGGGATIVFSLVAIAVAVVLVRMSTRLVSMWWAVALGLMLGGALGNFIDRLFREPGSAAGACGGFPAIAQLPGVQRG
jgi:signal peptidase II